MKSEIAPFGARLVDCVTVLGANSSAALKTAGVDGCVRYLGGIGTTEVAAILGAGLGLQLVSYADQFDGPSAVTAMTKLGYPAGATCWLDVEGLGPKIVPSAVIAEINAWSGDVAAAGWLPGIYVGAGALLTSAELYALPKVQRYWKGQSRLQDRNGGLVEPACGWCQWQAYPTQTIGGVEVDINMVVQDFQDRRPTWCIA